MSNKDLEDLFSHPTRAVNESTDGLTVLFRKLLKEIGISYAEFNWLLVKYVDNHKPNEPVDKKTNLKSAIKGALSRPNMTFKTFCRFIAILNPENLNINVTVTFKDGETFSQDTDIKFHRPRPPKTKPSGLPKDEE